ncbi:MAG TPA: hypothetical protein VFO38_04045 [Candidatus Saccharimonadales bacterium]|nr:hypothetical protein [Candidatus Saccharimonadales bacterium]
MVSVGVETGGVTLVALVRGGALADVVVATTIGGEPCVVVEVICRPFTLESDSVTNFASVGLVPPDGLGVVECDSCAASGAGAGDLEGCTLYRCVVRSPAPTMTIRQTAKERDLITKRKRFTISPQSPKLCIVHKPPHGVWCLN